MARVFTYGDKLATIILSAHNVGCDVSMHTEITESTEAGGVRFWGRLSARNYPKIKLKIIQDYGIR